MSRGALRWELYADAGTYSQVNVHALYASWFRQCLTCPAMRLGSLQVNLKQKQREAYCSGLRRDGSSMHRLAEDLQRQGVASGKSR